MALTRGTRIASMEAERSKDTGGISDMTSSDVGNSNIEISQPSDIHGTYSPYYAPSRSSVGTSQYKIGYERKRMRDGDSFDDGDDSQLLEEERNELHHKKKRNSSRKTGRLESIYESIKSFFFDNTNEQDKQRNLLRRGRYHQKNYIHSPRGNKRMISGSNANSKRMLKKKVLRREKQNRQDIQGGFIKTQNMELTETNNKLRNQLGLLEQKLDMVSEDLKFAREKNALFEKLLDDANVDRSYVKSRRDIRNLEKHNIKPQDELPPSPERKVNPLVTSSPIRRLSTDQPDNRNLNLAPPKINFYSKYPTIPHTESLSKSTKLSSQQIESELNTEKIPEKQHQSS